MQENALFIHTLWRTSSTWWWLQFRNNPAFTAFYEPFHENLLTRTQAQCAESHSTKPKAKIFHHPETPDHYFSEYPLRETGGVTGFDKRFTLDSFVRAHGDKDAEMTSYVRSLIDHARAQGKDAAFKFSRAALRGEWLKENLGGMHAYLVREPAAMFESSLAFAQNPVPGGPGNYFLACPVMILAQNSANPLFAPSAQRFGLTPFHAPAFKTEIEHFSKIADTLDVSAHKDISALLWGTGLAHATHYADLVIDADLARDKVYRAKIAGALAAGTGKPVSINDDYALPVAKAPFSISAEGRVMVREAIEILKPDWNRFERNVLSQASQEALDLIASRPGYSRLALPSAPTPRL